MYFKSKHTSLILLGITAIICSRLMFVFINDPEGPNLLIVAVAAAVVYALSLGVYLFGLLPPSLKGFNRLAAAVLFQILLVAAFYAFNTYTSGQSQMVAGADYKNAEYVIDGQHVKLQNGVAETEAAPGSASKIITRIFGNELKTDLDGDGKEDVAFILTQEGGGSGTFFYAVAALAKDGGYVGSDGYLLGDRVAPQATTLSQNPKQKFVVVFNYADRAPGEPFTTAPSVGKSAYLKLDSAHIQWAVVEPNFEGESR